MTQEELRMNRELLKEVVKVKKQGNFENVFEECVNKKVTSEL